MTAAIGLRALCFILAVSLAWSDCYMHNPRGSNNRLRERSANRNNANRLFDSQVTDFDVKYFPVHDFSLLGRTTTGVATTQEKLWTTMTT